MDQAAFDKLISDLEKQASGVKYDFEISELFGKQLEEHQKDFSPEQQEQLKWEFLLFRLMTKNRFANDGIKTERFVPMATFTDGKIFPDPNGFPDTAFDYFEKRARTSGNSILKARYLDLLWEKSQLKQKHLFATEAIEQYLLTLEEYNNPDTIIEKLDGIQRATELALTLETKKTEQPFCKKIAKTLADLIEKTAKEKEYRWLIEMFELVIALNTLFTDKQIQEYIELTDTAAKHYAAVQNFHLQRSFLKLKSSLAKIGRPKSLAKKTVDDEIGQSWIDEANKSGSGLVKVHYLQEAINHYSKLGDTHKVKELTTQVKNATKQAIDNHEFKQVSSTIELKKEDLDKLKASLGVGEELPELMGTSSSFFPNWSHAVELTKELSKKYVMSHLFAKVTYSEKYPVVAPQTPEQQQEDQVMDNFKIDAELKLSWLTRFLGELISEKKVSVEDFKKFFLNLKTIDPNTYDTILEGLESYFKGDYFHATYVLTLQLEDVLRQLLTIFGEETTVPEAGAFREKTLGSVLRELKPHISEPVYYYISWVMEDYRGFNLRNNVAHGFFKKKNANPIYPTAILHIFCLIFAHLAIKEEEKNT